MPAILTEAQICLAYDMEVVAEAMAGGLELPPDPRLAAKEEAEIAAQDAPPQDGRRKKAAIVSDDGR
jgi:hypothetical protein